MADNVTPLILLAVPVEILSARVGTGAGVTFALPARSAVLAWQTSFDVNPAAVNITLRISLDGVNWVIIDTTTTVGGELRFITEAIDAVFIDVNVVTNTGNRAVTVLLLAKVSE